MMVTVLMEVILDLILKVENLKINSFRFSVKEHGLPGMTLSKDHLLFILISPPRIEVLLQLPLR